MKTFLEWSGFPPSPSSTAATDVGTTSTLFSPPQQPKPLKKSTMNTNELETQPSILSLELKKASKK